jgi:hypothetical protein
MESAGKEQPEKDWLEKQDITAFQGDYTNRKQLTWCRVRGRGYRNLEWFFM